MEHGTRQMTIGKVSDLFVGPKNEKHENPHPSKNSKDRAIESAKPSFSGDVRERQHPSGIDRQQENEKGWATRRSRVKNQNREIIRQGSGGGVRFDRGKQVGSHGGGIADH